MKQEPFCFWRVVDGVAVPEYSDDAVNANPHNVYGSIEGAIINGGVIAVAFKRTTETTYDAAAWLFHDKRVPMGEITTTVYTAGQQYVIGDA